MDAGTISLAQALAPAFAAGFALQRLFEIFDFAFDWLPAQQKKIALNVLALAVGLFLASVGALRVLEPLGVENKVGVDVMVTGLVISGGTEGFNSIMKFLGYKKEEKKGQAKVAATPAADPAAG